MLQNYIFKISLLFFKTSMFHPVIHHSYGKEGKQTTSQFTMTTNESSSPIRAKGDQSSNFHFQASDKSFDRAGDFHVLAKIQNKKSLPGIRPKMKA